MSACGGKSVNPGVANLTNEGTTTTTPASGSGTPSSGTVPSGGNTVLHLAVGGAKAEQFSQCMRKNGVPDFPDPSSTGGVSIGPGDGIDPRSPKFEAAAKACRKILPNGGQPSPAQIAKAQQNALEFSKCMRTHGVANFPDPVFSTGGGIGIKIQANSKGGLNPSDPTFQKAQSACQGQFGFAKGPASLSPPGGK
jgi:hypothetical protein